MDHAKDQKKKLISDDLGWLGSGSRSTESVYRSVLETAYRHIVDTVSCTVRSVHGLCQILSSKGSNSGTTTPGAAGKRQP